jgi:signal peptidase I
MTIRTFTTNLLFTVGFLVAFGLLWFAAAPTRLGGSVDYVSIYGVSMEPKLHRGDLAVLLPSSSYRVGDVVGYRNRQLDRTLLHRIVRRDGDRYVMKGDNNDSVDAYEATSEDLVGRMWFRAPAVGRALSWSSVPGHAALVAGLATFPLLLGGGVASARKRRGTGTRRVPVRIRGAWGPFAASAGRAFLVPSLVATGAFGLLTLDARHHAATHVVDLPGAYVHHGAFSYRAQAAPGEVYPAGALRTGQTIFSRLARRVDFGFSYRFTAPQAHSVHGVGSVALSVASSLGWTRPLPSPPSKPFQGDSLRMTQQLDLPKLNRALSRYLAETGVSNDSFTLLVTPLVKVKGLVGGQQVASSFHPEPLAFVVDSQTLRLAHPILGSAAPGAAPVDQLRPSSTESMPATRGNRMRVFFLNGEVSRMRKFALLGFLVSALVAAAAIGAIVVSRSPDELTRIRRRYGHQIVSVTAAPGGAAVDTATFDDLAVIAATDERVILQLTERGTTTFFVDDDGTVYRYRVGLPAPDPARGASDARVTLG